MEPGGATSSQTGARRKVRIKQENDGDSNATHSHTVNVKFNASKQKETLITCLQPRTVLELLKSNSEYKVESYENIVIQMGNKKSIIATHFPCTCIKDNELLTLFCKSKKVEEAPGQDEKSILSKGNYSVFFIDTVGGLNARSKDIFKNNAVNKFKFVVVYGEKGMTVEEALKRDGRFSDDLGDFSLSHNENPHQSIDCSQPVMALDKKEFQLCLKPNTPKKNQGASNTPKEKCNTLTASAVVHQGGISVRTAMTKSDGTADLKKIYEELRKQFPGLKEWMESRFPGDSYQKALNLKSEDFGKIQQSFSEVHRVREIVKLGGSVCKVIVKIVEGLKTVTGTGFVLFDNYILTNAHLFDNCFEGRTLKQGVNVSVHFNYEIHESFTNVHVFDVVDYHMYNIKDDLDYAVLMLNPEGKKLIENKETRKIKVPPGLLKKVGPIPLNGEACIIGHPGGQVKQMDPICIIEKENRGKAVDENLHPYRDTQFTIQSIHHLIKKQGIDQIMIGGKRADKGATYNTFMYHGSSGSPVFDADCKVFGLHTRGFVYGFPKEESESVIEFAQPLLTILKHFVDVLKKSGDENMSKLLKRVEQEIKGNSDAKKIFEAVGIKVEPDDPEEISDSLKSMNIG